MTSTIRVATDVGGTFTDLVYFETDVETGRQTVRTAKVRHHAAQFRGWRARCARTRPEWTWRRSIFSPTARRW